MPSQFGYSHKNLSKVIIGMGLCLLLTGCMKDQPAIEILETPTHEPVMADCFVYFYLSAWEDRDGNGIWDAGEPPLAGVEFSVGGNYAHSLRGGKGISDESGEAVIDTWSPGGCLESSFFSVSAASPEGYQLTTESPIRHDANSLSNGSYEFGFRRVADN